MEKTEVAIFGEGCFWHVQATFDRLKGVVETFAGYAGGHVAGVTYKQVCTGKTGHAEVVKVIFDPVIITFNNLLETFWSTHDPTTPNRQGPDVGHQYRSIILYTTDDQHTLADASKKNIQSKFSRPIVSEIVPLKVFWPAEDYHQHYYDKNGTRGCAVPL